MTPLQLRMLLDVFVSPEPIDLTNDTRREQFMEMVGDALIEARPPYEGQSRASYRVTERGRAFVEALLTMPYPERTVIWRIKHDFEQSEDDFFYR